MVESKISRVEALVLCKGRTPRLGHEILVSEMKIMVRGQRGAMFPWTQRLWVENRSGTFIKKIIG